MAKEEVKERRDTAIDDETSTVDDDVAGVRRCLPSAPKNLHSA